jgi:hypothetical protein
MNNLYADEMSWKLYTKREWEKNGQVVKIFFIHPFSLFMYNFGYFIWKFLLFIYFILWMTWKKFSNLDFSWCVRLFVWNKRKKDEFVRYVKIIEIYRCFVFFFKEGISQAKDHFNCPSFMTH